MTERMADHWWWRPGWRVGRSFYTWHFTFAGEGAVTAVAALYRKRLAGLPGLDLVPDQWLHLTTQGVGFADEISDREISGIAAAAATRLKAVPSFTAGIGPAVVTPEAILLDTAPLPALSTVRDELRGAIDDVLGYVGEEISWAPHVSVAYSNSDAPAQPYIDAVRGGETAGCLITHVDLIRLNRDNRMYEWTTVASVPLAAS